MYIYVGLCLNATPSFGGNFELSGGEHTRSNTLSRCRGFGCVMCVCVCMCVCMYVRVYLSVCLCVKEREQERDNTSGRQRST